MEESNWEVKKNKLSELLEKMRTINNRSGQVRNAICGISGELGETEKLPPQEAKVNFNSFFDHTLEKMYEYLDAILSDLKQIS